MNDQPTTPRPAPATRYAQRETFDYENQPYGPMNLIDCTWEEYDDRPGLGEVTGTIAGGYSISRLFQYTSRTDHEIGSPGRIPYVPRSAFLAGSYVRASCG